MRQKQIMAGGVTAVAFVAMEFLIHNVLMGGMYKDTSSVWRMENEMKSLLPLMLLGQALFGFFFGVVYAKGYEAGKEPLRQGFRYGALMGMMLAPMQALVWYVILPIPGAIAINWFVFGMIQMMLLGVVSSQVYKP